MEFEGSYPWTLIDMLFIFTTCYFILIFYFSICLVEIMFGVLVEKSVANLGVACALPNSIYTNACQVGSFCVYIAICNIYSMYIYTWERWSRYIYPWERWNRLTNVEGVAFLWAIFYMDYSVSHHMHLVLTCPRYLSPWKSYFIKDFLFNKKYQISSFITSWVWDGSSCAGSGFFRLCFHFPTLCAIPFQEDKVHKRWCRKRATDEVLWRILPSGKCLRPALCCLCTMVRFSMSFILFSAFIQKWHFFITVKDGCSSASWVPYRKW